MKEMWAEPRIEVQKFAANEYVAACAIAEWFIILNVMRGIGGRITIVYLADGTPYATSGRDYGGCKTDYESYHPCGETHSAESDSGFLKGYMYAQNFWGNDSGQRINVIIWTEDYTNVHCTTNLDMESWTTEKS